MKFNFKPIKNLNVGAISTLIIFLLIIVELYFVYALIYKNLNPEPLSNVTNRIVQVNLSSYTDTLDYVDSLETFEPKEMILTNPNPFKYNR
jgi:hypothetical protein